MIIDLRKLIKATAIPIVILTACFFLYPYFVKPFPKTVRIILPYIPYLIFITGMILSWVFHHSREFNLLLLISIIYIALGEYVWSPAVRIDSRLAITLLTLLIPINYFLNFVLKERGILNQFGIRRFVFLGIQLFIFAWLLENPQPQLKTYLYYTFIKLGFLKDVTISQPILIAIIMTAIVFIVRLFQTTSTLIGGMTGSLIALTLALNFSQNQQVATTFIIISGILIISAITINAYSLAYLDELTNLPSRRALKQNISTLGRRYAIAMVDVDHFKKFNDKYGHDIGDQVLKKLASHLRQVRGGKAFRYGGEEFTLLFPNKNLNEARIFCNELCKKVANSPFMLRNKKRPNKKPGESKSTFKRREATPLKITISIGIAERSQSLPDPDAVIKQSDKALYKAKDNGRNQVAV